MKTTPARRIAAPLLFASLLAFAVNARADAPILVPDAVPDRFEPSDRQRDIFQGVIGERLRGNLENRLLTVDLDSILEPFRHRPGAQEWVGEHVGKFLHAGCLVWRQTGDPRLKARLDEAAKGLMETQLDDGYLGTYLEKDRWTSWDVWSHKYNMIGLLSYYQATGDPEALAACRRMGDLLCDTFGEGKRDVITSGTHVGMAPSSVLEPMVLLYRCTYEQRYLDFCEYLVRAWEQEHGPKLISSLTSHGEVFKTANNKAYEMMSCLVGLLDLHQVTGRPEYLRACVNAWQDIRDTQNYPTGSSSWAEHFRDPHDLITGGDMQGDKYVAAGEGCVTVTWMQMNQRLLQLTGETRYADELERTIYNALLAAQSPLDGTVCYFLPMTGRKRFGEVNHGIQPDICCCASSVPRGMALVPSCSAGLLDGGPALTMYHAGQYRFGDDDKMTLTVSGDFPVNGDVRVVLDIPRPTDMPVSLRVPSWCPAFAVRVGDQIHHGRPGQWLSIRRVWRPDDELSIRMELPLFTEPLAVAAPNQVVIRRGPQVLAVDQSLEHATSLPSNWIGKQLYTMDVLRGGEAESLSLTPIADAGQLGADYQVVQSNVLLDTSDAGRELIRYRADLEAFRQEYGGARRMPAVEFFQFGMGDRPKLLFKDGVLSDALTGRIVQQWDARRATIVPPAYLVAFTTAQGERVRIQEDESGVWIEENGERRRLEGTESPLKLPDFDGHRYASILRVLHHEILINIVDGRPVPNFYVYRKPWHRDAAMMALCLQKTGNEGLLREWVLGLADPYDRNNKGRDEADNPGEVLYLLSLAADKDHPLVKKILADLPRFEVTDDQGTYIKGFTDFEQRPVYQTKWLKFGLQSLGLPHDRYTIPSQQDAYSALFWMDYRDEHVPGADAEDRHFYPYLGWAVDHFRGEKRSPISNRDYPLTWESRASSAVYPGMARIDPVFVKEQTSVPHTWHAAEVFLHVLD